MPLYFSCLTLDAIAAAQRFTLAFVEDALNDVPGRIVEKLANLCFVNSEPVRIASEFGYGCAMTPNDLQESIKIPGWFGPAFDGEKIDDLNEKFGPAFAGFAHGLDQLFQSGKKSIVADAQKGPTRNITHSRGFDDQRRGLASSKSSLPIEVILRHKSVFGRAPRHHRRHPGAALEGDRPDLSLLKQE